MWSNCLKQILIKSPPSIWITQVSSPSPTNELPNPVLKTTGLKIVDTKIAHYLHTDCNWRLWKINVTDTRLKLEASVVLSINWFNLCIHTCQGNKQTNNESPSTALLQGYYSAPIQPLHTFIAWKSLTNPLSNLNYSNGPSIYCWTCYQPGTDTCLERVEFRINKQNRIAQK